MLDGNLKPWHLKTDRGSEFKNKAVSRLLKEMGVKHLTQTQVA
jgi:transposase InsO family protein